MPRARPGFDTPRMAYLRRPHELDYFVTSRWVDRSSRMLGPLLAQALEQTGSFRAIVQTPGVVPADIRLDTELIRMQQEFRTQPSRVVSLPHPKRLPRSSVLRRRIPAICWKKRDRNSNSLGSCHMPICWKAMPPRNSPALAGQIGADLIVIGHRHISRLRRMVENSVERSLVSRTPCSVMISLDKKQP